MSHDSEAIKKIEQKITANKAALKVNVAETNQLNAKIKAASVFLSEEIAAINRDKNIKNKAAAEKEATDKKEENVQFFKDKIARKKKESLSIDAKKAELAMKLRILENY